MKREGRGLPSQCTLQRMVPRQWQRQEQWKVHSLLTISGPRGSRPGLALASCPLTSPSSAAGLGSGKPIAGSRLMGFTASIFNEAFPAWPIRTLLST